MKIERRQKRFEVERLMKTKRSEDYKTLEEVFDKPTLMTVYSLLNKGVVKDISGVIKSGKESRIYGGEGAEGTRIAIKIYLTSSAEFKKGMVPYIVGDPRFKIVKRDFKVFY
jgi:RIO kinase 1